MKRGGWKRMGASQSLKATAASLLGLFAFLPLLETATLPSTNCPGQALFLLMPSDTPVENMENKGGLQIPEE